MIDAQLDLLKFKVKKQQLSGRRLKTLLTPRGKAGISKEEETAIIFFASKERVVYFF